MEQVPPMFEIVLQKALELRSYTLSFTISPVQWATLNLPVALVWSKVRFDSESIAEVPDDQSGVYSFVVEPAIANHPSCAQSFKERYRDYLKHQREEKTRRPYVQFMLRMWPKHLWFYYAPIADIDQIIDVEDQLLAAFKPPIPRAFPSELRGPISLLSLLGG